jgi:hypothetical protein
MPASLNATSLHADFLSILPAIETHGQICFRHLRCPHKKEDALQEMRALGWKLFLALVQRGKDIHEFLTTFNTFLARAVHNGRRLTGMARAKDVLNPIMQKRRGFKVETLPTSTRIAHERLYALPNGQQLHDAWEERLRDNTVTPVPEQVAFRIDFPAWRLTRCHRDRQILDGMMDGERTQDLSEQFGISPARVSQLRREFHDDWRRFLGEFD